jgi:virulence-associated protein VagC
MKTTTVFQSGHSQAVRMPKEFRFAVRTVTIRREGEAVILEPVRARGWPEGFFASARIADPSFQRPAQGDLPPARALDADP